MRFPLLFCLCVGALWAAPVTMEFTATVTKADDLLTAHFSAGDVVTGAYRFESGTPDAAGDPASGLYFNAGSLFSAATGAFGFLAATVDIAVTNSAVVDIYRVVGSTVSGAGAGGFSIHQLELALTGNTGLALASDALPLVPPLLGGFEIRTLTLTFVDGATVASVVARVDTLQAEVPEPALALPLLCALGWLSRRRGNRGGPGSPSPVPGDAACGWTS